MGIDQDGGPVLWLGPDVPMSANVTAELIHALIENMKGARDDWASLAMVIDLRAGRVSGTHGYAYSPDGTVSAVASAPQASGPSWRRTSGASTDRASSRRWRSWSSSTATRGRTR